MISALVSAKRQGGAAARALTIAIVGAESTGKTTLAAGLAAQLARDTGLRVAWVPEALRAWCDNVGRTPQAQEQASILHQQQANIDAATALNDVVVCDTTALMTAVYSRMFFGDLSLEARAVQLHRRVTLTLLTALDLPWVADGRQRDGPHVQAPGDALLRELLLKHRLPWALVGGRGPERLERALDAVAPLLRARAGAGNGSRGLFTRLAARGAETSGQRWACECCEMPACKRVMRKA